MPDQPINGAETLDRFWAKVEKTEGCWNWTASMDGYGYGGFRVEGKLRKSHRFSYELSNGPIPEGMFIDHICHNRACVNPSHLRLATNKQNMEHKAGPSVNNTSGIRGVTWNKGTRKWLAQVTHNYKNHYVGVFSDIAEAEAAVIAKRNELFTHNNLDRSAA